LFVSAWRTKISTIYYLQDGLDFNAEFDGRIFHIESTYLHGPDFKTQEYQFSTKNESASPIYKIRPDKLIELFQNIYSKKKAQVMNYTPSTSNVPKRTELKAAANRFLRRGLGGIFGSLHPFKWQKFIKTELLC
jgi:hypothetical protein